MKTRILVSLTIALIASFPARAAAVASQRVLHSTKEEATFSLTLVCSLDGIFQREERVFYFRPSHDATDLGAMLIDSTNADGASGGFGLTVTAKPRESIVEVEVLTHWTSKNARGKNSLTLSAPYFEAQRGQDAGFTYTLAWRKLK